MKFAAFAALMAAVPGIALAQGATTAAAEQNKPITRAEVSTELDTDYADLDGDKDGKVTSAEINARLVKSAQAQLDEIKKERDAAFAKLDADSNGSISKAEFEARAKLPTMKDPDAKPFLDRFDKNKDGNISKDEFRAPTLANFDSADKNKDGTLSVSERTAMAAPKKVPVKETPPVGR